MNKIAFFDFDGTITTKDTLLELIKFQKGKAALYKGFFQNSPMLVGLKLKLVDNQKAKEKILTHFFAGMELSAFQSACDGFIDEVLPGIINPKALAEIETLKAAGFKVVVVSASAENWIRKWCDSLDIKLLATRLEVENSRLTGNISGYNCTGEEKVIRINASYDLSEYDEIHAYGDTSGDIPMLCLATKAFYEPFG